MWLQEALGLPEQLCFDIFVTGNYVLLVTGYYDYDVID